MFYNIINLIKMNYICKKKKLNLKIYKKDLKIIQIFVKLNLITIVKKNINKNLIVDIYFQYIGGEPLFKNIKNLNKPSKTTLINYKQLLKINKKNNSLFIISTNKGLITNFEAEKYKIGGNIILKIII
jgi:ribosomal protein S8